ncbi:MAG: hypothetical protein KIT09_01060 [Bryobacteraceae bacterium]|nr:hypothetical protein [Bryobacteraceae bacterium]
MLASILIIAVSTALFLYWFRYTCLLILSTRTNRDYSLDVAAAKQLSFPGFSPGEMASAAGAELAAIQKSLDRDYRVVTSLLRQMGEVEIGGNSLEHMMLRVDFRLMSAVYRVSKSRAALAEMCQVVAHIANRCGERSAVMARM